VEHGRTIPLTDLRAALLLLRKLTISLFRRTQYPDFIGFVASRTRRSAMRRRDFMKVMASVAAWPLAAHAQLSDQMRRIAALIALPENDPELKKWLRAFRQGLEKLGWSEGRNLHIDYRFAPAGAGAPVLAKELLSLNPEIILALSTPATAAFQQETRTIPVVFIGIADTVGQGFVRSLAHPGGNLTGLTKYEPSVTGKWLEMLKEIEPQLARAAFVLNPKTAPNYDFYVRGAKVAAPSVGIEPVLTPIENDAADVKRVIASFAQSASKGGLVVPGDSTTNAHRDLIVSLAAQHRLPAVYSNEFRRRRWPHELRSRLGKRVWAGDVLRRPHSARRQTCRTCSAGGD
jgi:ABC-type uncharacterized transport system substrate-binding protein